MRTGSSARLKAKNPTQKAAKWAIKVSAEYSPSAVAGAIANIIRQQNGIEINIISADAKA
jgi:hypothetical protein